MKKVLAFTGKLGSGKDYTAMQHITKLKDNGNSIYMCSFADPIKQILYNSFGVLKNQSELSLQYISKEDSLSLITRELHGLFYSIDKTVPIDKIIANYKIYEDDFYMNVENCINNIEYNYSYRRLGQLLGTELGRYLVDSVWIDTAFYKIKKVFGLNLATYAVISDCRFVNEYIGLNYFSYKTGYETKCYGVVASDETRAERRKMSISELKAQDNHGSEKEVDDIIAMLPTDQIIDNN